MSSDGGEESDAALAERTLAGDDQGFARLMSRHKAWAYRFIRRYVGDADEAYDILQDTFFSAWLALSRYQRDRPFDAWLRRIALNKCRDRARRESVRRLVLSPLNPGRGSTSADRTPDPIDHAAGPEALAASAQELQQLERAISRLPRSLKEPLLLTSLEGLSHKEAGELLGLNAKAVEMRVYRARERLNARLASRHS